MKEKNEQKPLVGIALIIIKDKKDVLLGKRKGSHGEGTWSFPGGHLKYCESIERCSRRESKEETGLTEANIKLIDKRPHTITEDLFPEGLHYITLYLRAKYLNGFPKVIEPDKCEIWKWFSWGNLPSPLFLPIRNLIKQGYNPFE